MNKPHNARLTDFKETKELALAVAIPPKCKPPKVRKPRLSPRPWEKVIKASRI